MRNLAVCLSLLLLTLAPIPALAGFASEYSADQRAPAAARGAWHAPRRGDSLRIASGASRGNVHSRAGASATVAGQYAAAFQALVNDLEARGAVIRFMGGYRAGTCGQANKHACGMALDLCQYSRDVVDRRCGLSRQVVAEVASRHGLFSGGLWCSPDFGHVEAGGSVACGHGWARRRARRQHYAHI